MDIRETQLEKDIATESQVVAGSYAFKGFGRSTEHATADTEVTKRGQELSGQLQSLISAEAELKRVQTGDNSDAIKAASEAVSGAFTQYRKLQKQQQERITKASTELIGYAQARDAFQNAESQLTGRRRKKEFVLRAKPKEISPQHTLKSLDTLKSSFDSLPNLSSLSLQNVLTPLK